MTTKKEMKAVEVLENRRNAFHKKVRSLLGHVRPSAKEIEAAFAKADQYSYAEVAAEFAAEVASREPVGAAIHAQKAAAVEFAEQDARKIVARVEKELIEHGNDRHAYAPYPRSGYQGNPEYDRAEALYSLVHQLTKSRQYVGRMNEPDLADLDADMVERFVDNSRRHAAAQYDAFICKMVAKVGKVESAQLRGDHVWSYSHLTVAKAGGISEVWKTQQIVNYTKYGRPYLQWPSRLIKGKGR